MSTTIPPARKIAAPSIWGTATMVELWRMSDEAGVSLGSLLRALDQLEGADPESVGK